MCCCVVVYAGVYNYMCARLFRHVVLCMIGNMHVCVGIVYLSMWVGVSMCGCVWLYVWVVWGV